MENVKIVTVGDGAVGKTCAMVSYSRDKFPETYVPTVFDNYLATVMVTKENGKRIPVSAGLWDTAGQEEYDRLRPLSYPNTDAFLVCYSIANPTSLSNVCQKWFPELRHHNPDTPFILVGLKADLRNNAAVKQKLARRGRTLVSKEEAARVGAEIGAVKTMECSAKTQENLKSIFDEAIKAALNNRDERMQEKKRKRLCMIL